jgi:hypothetical protein
MAARLVSVTPAVTAPAIPVVEMQEAVMAAGAVMAVAEAMAAAEEVVAVEVVVAVGNDSRLTLDNKSSLLGMRSIVNPRSNPKRQTISDRFAASAPRNDGARVR